jgi:hypothetical protein
MTELLMNLEKNIDSMKQITPEDFSVKKLGNKRKKRVREQ